METAVGACNGVRYSVDVRYWECPLIESPLYTSCLNIQISKRKLADVVQMSIGTARVSSRDYHLCCFSKGKRVLSDQLA